MYVCEISAGVFAAMKLQICPSLIRIFDRFTGDITEYPDYIEVTNLSEFDTDFRPH